MLARLTEDYFSDPGWIFERKLDGERCLALRNDGQNQLLSRNQQNLNSQYPELVDALAENGPDCFIADGEVVAFKGNITSFSRLQKRMHIQDPEHARSSQVAIYYYIFDLPYLTGCDLSQLPLRQRKVILKDVFSYQDPLRYVIHRNEKGTAYHQQACQKGWEGVIAKQADSPYLNGRSSKWLKFKCVNRQEFVIGGFTEPQGSRMGFGALLLGYYQDNKLAYAGKVGTGFDDQDLTNILERMSSLGRDHPPFADPQLPTSGVHWVEPQLVAQIGFEEWTQHGKLRHPRFQGLRQDKDPQEVIREEPQT
jgi:DNA ligase D-like protein (predicted ligase)